MGLIGKIFAIVMFPLSILIIFEALGTFSLSLPFNKVIIGAVLMIALQLLTLIFLKINHGKLGLMQYITAGIFIAIALVACFSGFVKFLPTDRVPLILGAVMLVEALYALH